MAQEDRIIRYWLLLIFAGLACQVQAQDTARLGIFGIVDGLDPLIVAGREITLPDAVKVISPLGPGEVIAAGDTLAVVVSVSEGRLVASRVMEVFPVIGPVGEVADGSASVMGTAVHIPPDVSVQSGQLVALSGLWSGDTMITSRLRRVDHDGFGQLVGAFEVAQDRIGGSEIIDAAQPPEGFGDHVWVLSGTPEPNGLRVRLMSKGVFGGEVALVLWQGYASLPVASQTYLIHGTGILGTATDALMPKAGSLVARCARQGRVVNAAPEGFEVAFLALGCAKQPLAD